MFDNLTLFRHNTSNDTMSHIARHFDMIGIIVRFDDTGNLVGQKTYCIGDELNDAVISAEHLGDVTLEAAVHAKRIHHTYVSICVPGETQYGTKQIVRVVPLCKSHSGGDDPSPSEMDDEKTQYRSKNIVDLRRFGRTFTWESVLSQATKVFITETKRPMSAQDDAMLCTAILIVDV